MRTMKRSLVLAGAFALGIACSRHIEEDVDAERLCRDFCELGDACEPEAPEFADGCPSVDDPCFDTCMDNGNRGWEDDCRFLLADYFECINDLTCEDFYGQSACSTVPRDQQACEEERGNYSTCASKQ